MLTKKELKQLRNEIVLNSLFLKDYSNTLFIKEKTACDFFNGYVDYLNEIAIENGYKNIDIVDIVDIVNDFDNIDNLYNYYLCYENDPLLKDDYIAEKTLTNKSSLVIYNINDYSVITSIIYLDGLYMKNTKLTSNRLHYDNKGDVYFIKYNKRYYASDFTRV